MEDLLAARTQMAISLMFHILFAIAGMAMPVLMVVSEALWLKTKRPLYLDLTRRWAKGTAILFAVGAVSGTVLSFELGLLWPKFMEHAGAIIGMPFSLEGFAFFTEAIFLGIYLYGWDKVPPRLHLGAGIIVAVSGGLSAVFVVAANAWMNTPTGFDLVDGQLTNIDPVAAMLNPAAFPQALHMLLAAYAAVGFAVAGIHAWVLLKHPGDPFHRAALAIALLVGVPSALLQPVSGDLLAQMVADLQPAKLAAMEAHFETQAGAPLYIGGLPDPETGTVRWAIKVPYGLSLLAHHDPNAVVIGLNDIPPKNRPNVVIVHIAFQIMVACGAVMALLGLVAAWFAFKRRKSSWEDLLPEKRWFLRSLVLASPLGVLAIEAGWFVTEVGRQPWIIQGVMRTRDALTPMPGLTVPLVVITLVYLVLGVIVIALLRRHVVSTVPSEEKGPIEVPV
jgi:cytochrome d ubiquinol oxidase subunit I